MNIGTEQSVGVHATLAYIKIIHASVVLDLNDDVFGFLTSNKVWRATERARARRCVEACVYGTHDFVRLRRLDALVVFIARVTAHYGHAVNIGAACLFFFKQKTAYEI